MDKLFTLLTEMVKNGDEGSAYIVMFVVVVAAVVGIPYGAIKFAQAMKAVFQNDNNNKDAGKLDNISNEVEKAHTIITSSTEKMQILICELHEKIKEVDVANETIRDELNKVGAQMNQITDSIEIIRNKALDDGFKRDVESSIRESTHQYLELTRKVTDLQKDLATMQGTIIGLHSSSRQRIQ